MKKFNLIHIQLSSLIIIILIILFGNTVHAETKFVPFYCIGDNCTENKDWVNPTPNASVNALETSQPCVEQNKGFFATIYGFIFALFDFRSKSRTDLTPCDSDILTSGNNSKTTTSPPIPSNPAIPSIQFIDHKVVTVTGKDMAITLGKLNSAAPGDIMIAMIGSDYAHVKTAPSGWNLIRQDVKNSGHKDDLAMQSYYKFVTANDESTFTWKMETARDDTPSSHQPLIAVDMYVFRGVDQTKPIYSNNSKGETIDPQAIECPSVKGIKGGMLVCAYIGDDPGSIIAPASMQQTSNFEISDGDSYAIAYELLTSDNETGLRTAVWNNPEKNSDGSLKSGSDFAQAVVLYPAN